MILTPKYFILNLPDIFIILFLKEPDISPVKPKILKITSTQYNS